MTGPAMLAWTCVATQRGSHTSQIVTRGQRRREATLKKWKEPQYSFCPRQAEDEYLKNTTKIGNKGIHSFFLLARGLFYGSSG